MGTLDAGGVARTDKPSLQEHVPSQVAAGATVNTDDHGSNGGMPNRRHERVRNNAGNYLRGMTHTNGEEGLRSITKRVHTVKLHKISPNLVRRYVADRRTSNRPAVGQERSEAAYGNRHSRVAIIGRVANPHAATDCRLRRGRP